DGRLLACATAEGAVCLQEVATGDLRQKFHCSQGLIEALAFSPDGALLASGAPLHGALVWDVTTLRPAGRPVPYQPARGGLEKLGADFGNPHGEAAHLAVWKLSAAPGAAIPLLAARLQPVPRLRPGQVPRLIEALGHDRFAVRDQAMRELEQLGDLAEPALR